LVTVQKKKKESEKRRLWGKGGRAKPTVTPLHKTLARRPLSQRGKKRGTNSTRGTGERIVTDNGTAEVGEEPWGCSGRGAGWIRQGMRLKSRENETGNGMGKKRGGGANTEDSS